MKSAQVAQTIEVEIEGLRELAPFGGAEGAIGRFELSGVSTAVVEWHLLGKILRDAGIEQTAVDQYVEQCADLVMTSELAKALAKRIKRVS